MVFPLGRRIVTVREKFNYSYYSLILAWTPFRDSEAGSDTGHKNRPSLSTSRRRQMRMLATHVEADSHPDP